MDLTPTTMETVSGRLIDLKNIRRSDLYLHDIFWSLSRQPRYGGHTVMKMPFSIAQHVVEVSRYIEEALTPGTHLFEVFGTCLQEAFEEACKLDAPHEMDQFHLMVEMHKAGVQAKTYAFHGLMHDFAEAYLNDLPTPVKRLPGIYDAYKAYEEKTDALIYDHFGLEYSENRYPLMWKFGCYVVGWADAYALAIEAYHMMPSRGRTWKIQLAHPPSFDKITAFRGPLDWETAYKELEERFNELRPALRLL